MERPRIKPKLSKIDYLFETLYIIGLVSLVFLPIYFYNELPATIPKHFDILGQPDSYGDKVSIWILPITGFVLFIGMTILNRFPFIFNYPVTVTEENAERLYDIGTRTIRILKFLVVSFFLYLNYITIKIGLKQSEGSGNYSVLIFLALSLILVVIMILKMIKLRPKTKI